MPPTEIGPDHTTTKFDLQEAIRQYKLVLTNKIQDENERRYLAAWRVDDCATCPARMIAGLAGKVATTF